MGDEVRVTVIAAGFDRFENESRDRVSADAEAAEPRRAADLFATEDTEEEDGADDDFDVPSFLK